MMESLTLNGVREYSEGHPVEIGWCDEAQRFVIIATNQGGHDCVQIDLADLVKWMKDGAVDRLISQ